MKLKKLKTALMRSILYIKQETYFFKTKFIKKEDFFKNQKLYFQNFIKIKKLYFQDFIKNQKIIFSKSLKIIFFDKFTFFTMNEKNQHICHHKMIHSGNA